ncbi:glycosyltransferase family 25 protein [Rhodoblastus acidophilus]|uniref:Glycosyltransferase family 25 protein n=1 Tax=Candidatus Rhodoblastus alkanivorans TaxID=2954117 RepID=A0ABS9Z4G7_9HYPH|nr:glycosyltransferase family 25 protein [Candidatus Rhodoblastus alkanivorans]MCI4677699.1 glycosyltransferase family 25 protein [Candidatus Rhodoblastus alkanivorans]MCI4682569.1 glycosyltransferase family 25 protein [Candidatus Rhodoblastus alkanivorans]MDI4639875.1 glycosyltransferase family 25 protein [Rhodoblastus acidophilus]
MKVYYINLDRAPERRVHTEQMLQGVDFERVAAVDGSRNPPTKKGLNRFQIACIDSHRIAWRKFLATPDSFACFLEDDLHFSPEFPAFVIGEYWIPAEAHAVKLDSFYNVVMVGAQSPAPLGRGLARLYTRHESSAAYILSRRGAETFLRLSENPTRPVDYILFPEDPIGERLNVFQLTPAVAVQDSRYEKHHAPGANFVSAIARTDRPGPDGFLPRLWFKLKRETIRVVHDIGRARRYLVNRLFRRLKPEVIPFR